jgi:hypothetical protein
VPIAAAGLPMYWIDSVAPVTASVTTAVAARVEKGRSQASTRAA